MSCSSELTKRKTRSLGPPITEAGKWGLKDGWEQSNGSEPFTFGIWGHLWVDSVRTERNGGTPSWCCRERLSVRKNRHGSGDQGEAFGVSQGDTQEREAQRRERSLVSLYRMKDFLSRIQSTYKGTMHTGINQALWGADVKT